jgi:protein-S-isoprenylcysteine O-methyltransferase Ste14
MLAERISEFLRQNRIKVTRFFVAVFFLIFLFSQHKIEEKGFLDYFMELTSIVLIFLGTYGRLWCTLFISGYKTNKLITVGPYSICRNPLYFFSFIGTLGIALQTEMITFVVIAIFGFAFLYSIIIKGEEKKLLEIHGKEFEEYCKRVPRFFPKFSLYTEPETYQFNTLRYRRAFMEGMWFVIIYPVFEIIEQLHNHGILPAFFKIW